MSARVGRERDINDVIEPNYADFVSSLRGNRKLSDAVAAGTAPVLYFETSRGCWWGQRSHCTFCGLNGLTMNYRTMDPALARKQLETLFSYAPWCTTYACTDNIMPRTCRSEVLAHLQPPANSSIFFEVKVPVSERDLKIMARSAVNRGQPGIESLATDTLTLMGEGTTSFQNIQFLKSCIRHDIEPVWNLLIGFRGEQEAVYRKYREGHSAAVSPAAAVGHLHGAVRPVQPVPHQSRRVRLELEADGLLQVDLSLRGRRDRELRVLFR
ncbi:radical SAM protein [Micromonospora sp. CPCC 206060]|uniref:radical SAM protein n=1 Tax=Micromonospora sp. CPCC 206060 TaxID=3122406 RepID=UPI002FF3DF89